MAKREPLPLDFSAVIRLALADENACFKSREVNIDMNVWHRPNYELRGERRRRAPECTVCLAGAVMRQHMAVPDAQWVVDPTDEDLVATKRERALLEALECLRAYNFCAVTSLVTGRKTHFRVLAGIPQDKWMRVCGKINDIPRVSYGVDRRRWRRNMFRVAKLLESVGA